MTDPHEKTVYSVTAWIPAHHAEKVGTWADSVKPFRFDGVTVTERFDARSHEEAKDKMSRVLIPLGVSIANLESRAITARTI